MPDAPQRIATDTSQKLPIRFGETIKKYVARGLDMDNLVLIPLTLAGYARYLKGLDDEGHPFEPPCRTPGHSRSSRARKA